MLETRRSITLSFIFLDGFTSHPMLSRKCITAFWTVQNKRVGCNFTFLLKPQGDDFLPSWNIQLRNGSLAISILAMKTFYTEAFRRLYHIWITNKLNKITINAENCLDHLTRSIPDQFVVEDSYGYFNSLQQIQWISRTLFLLIRVY